MTETYIYTVADSDERNMNVRVNVWRIKRNKPEYVGVAHRNTASWRGAPAVAARIIADEQGYAMEDGYELVRDDIDIRKLADYR